MTEERKLTQCEIVFCYEYIASKFNGTLSYQSAFGTKNKRSAAAEASKLLTNLNIKAKIKELTDKHLQTLGYNANDILKELAKLAFSNVDKHMDFDGETISLKSFDEMGESTGAIREFEINEHITTDSEGQSYKDIKTKFKLHNKKGSLELLGKGLQLFVDRHIIETDDIAEKMKLISEYVNKSTTVRENNPDSI